MFQRLDSRRRSREDSGFIRGAGVKSGRKVEYDLPRIYPLFGTFINALENGEYVAHVDPEEQVGRIGLVEEKEAAGPEHTAYLTVGQDSVLVDVEMMEDPDRIHKVERFVAEG